MNLFKTKNRVIPYTMNKVISPNSSISIDCEKGNNICILGTTYQVYLYYKFIKAPNIHFGNYFIEVILPYPYKKIGTAQILKIVTEKLYHKIAQQELERAMEKIRLMVGFAPEDFQIKKLNNHKLSYCSTEKKEIIFSPDIVKYNRNTIEYIVLHEFCHLKYKIHAKGFWQMIQKYMPDYKRYEASIA